MHRMLPRDLAGGESATFGYPAPCWDPRDPDGEHGETAEKQYFNTVFRTEAEAIENARRNLHAHIRHRARALQEARGIVEQATQECAQAAEEFAALLRYEEQRAPAPSPCPSWEACEGSGRCLAEPGTCSSAEGRMRDERNAGRERG
jgi:hypothetical protein